MARSVHACRLLRHLRLPQGTMVQSKVDGFPDQDSGLTDPGIGFEAVYADWPQNRNLVLRDFSCAFHLAYYLVGCGLATGNNGSGTAAGKMLPRNATCESERNLVMPIDRHSSIRSIQDLCQKRKPKHQPPSNDSKKQHNLLQD